MHTGREGWWISHVPRAYNSWTDAVARQVQDAMRRVKLWIVRPIVWQAWCAGLQHEWLLSLDGSCRPEDSRGLGLGGSACTLWIWLGNFWEPVASLGASCSWTSAVDCEATAVWLALCLLNQSHDMFLHESMRLACRRWCLTVEASEWQTVHVEASSAIQLLSIPPCAGRH